MWIASHSGARAKTFLLQAAVRDCVPVVTEKYAEYRNEQLADLWAKLTLDRMGVEVPGTEEPL